MASPTVLEQPQAVIPEIVTSPANVLPAVLPAVGDGVSTVELALLTQRALSNHEVAYLPIIGRYAADAFDAAIARTTAYTSLGQTIGPEPKVPSREELLARMDDKGRMPQPEHADKPTGALPSVPTEDAPDDQELAALASIVAANGVLKSREDPRRMHGHLKTIRSLADRSIPGFTLRERVAAGWAITRLAAEEFETRELIAHALTRPVQAPNPAVARHRTRNHFVSVSRRIDGRLMTGIGRALTAVQIVQLLK